MKNTWETFQTAYQNATDQQKLVVDSDVIPKCVRSVIESKKLDDSHYISLVKLQSLVTLSAANEAEALEELLKLGVPEGKMVFDELQTCIKNTPATVAPTPEQAPTTTEPVVPIPESNTDLNVVSDIAETEAELNSIPKIRTMEQDMAESQAAGEEKTYSSTQAAILKESKPAPVDNTPRWGEAE